MRDEFDVTINDAIRSYAGAEPSPELAANILRRAQQEPLQRRTGWRLALGVAVPVAAAVALAVVLVGRLSLPQAPTAVTVAPAAPTVAHTAKVLEPKPVRAQGRLVNARGNARPEARPLPAPYTKQELALVAFVEQNPKEAAVIAKAQSQPLRPIPEQPITISHLEIAPLTIASLDQEK